MKFFAVVVLCLPVAAAEVPEISADSLRGHVSFLASDLLAGRDTPSQGLDIAAEYIAAQFRRAGLEPAGDDGYFETANFLVVKPGEEGFEFVFESGGKTVRVPREKAMLEPLKTALDLTGAAVVRAGPGDSEVDKWTPEQLRGKVVLTATPDLMRLDQEGRRKAFEAIRAFRERMRKLKPALVVTVTRYRPFRIPGSRLIDPSDPEVADASPAVSVQDEGLAKIYEHLKTGPVDAKVTFREAARSEQPAKLRNVAGILRGSDPALKNTYVLVTAHYDHVGVQGGGEGDHIYNGANDDASGTASVIELAGVLAGLKERPRRSIVFMTYFGEEKGLLGSRYYGRHPIEPLNATVADLNLEQLGRTDGDDGKQIGRASLTGFDYSDVGETLRRAGEQAGVTVFKNESASDSFFGRSDNQALADIGIPAHTLCVNFVYPDYHLPGDEWQKLDYANMAKVNRMVALGVLMIANNPEPPKWNEANPKAARYVEAWKKRMGK